MLKTEPRKT